MEMTITAPPKERRRTRLGMRLNILKEDGCVMNESWLYA